MIWIDFQWVNRSLQSPIKFAPTSLSWINSIFRCWITFIKFEFFTRTKVIFRRSFIFMLCWGIPFVLFGLVNLVILISMHKAGCITHRITPFNINLISSCMIFEKGLVMHFPFQFTSVVAVIWKNVRMLSMSFKEAF